MMDWRFIEVIAGSSCVTNIYASSTKLAVVVLSDVLEGVTKLYLAVRPLQLS
jgi:hypothetical protein